MPIVNNVRTLLEPWTNPTAARSEESRNRQIILHYKLKILAKRVMCAVCFILVLGSAAACALSIYNLSMGAFIIYGLWSFSLFAKTLDLQKDIALIKLQYQTYLYTHTGNPHTNIDRHINPEIRAYFSSPIRTGLLPEYPTFVTNFIDNIDNLTYPKPHARDIRFIKEAFETSKNQLSKVSDTLGEQLEQDLLMPNGFITLAAICIFSVIEKNKLPFCLEFKKQQLQTLHTQYAALSEEEKEEFEKLKNISLQHLLQTEGETHDVIDTQNTGKAANLLREFYKITNNCIYCENPQNRKAINKTFQEAIQQI